MAFKLCCIFAAIFYTIVQAERFLKDEDSSKVSCRHFNIRPQDNYPDITFCLKGGHLSPAIEEFKVSEAEFIEALKGNLKLKHIGSESFQQISRFHADKYFVKFDDILVSYSIRNNLNEYRYNRKNKRVLQRR